jgi:hypothetical protein
MSCGSCKNQHFRGMYHLRHQGDKNRQTRNNVSSALVRRFLLAWWWTWYVPPKHRFLQEPHGITSQKKAFFIVTTVETSNLTILTVILLLLLGGPCRKKERESVCVCVCARARMREREREREKVLLCNYGFGSCCRAWGVCLGMTFTVISGKYHWTEFTSVETVHRQTSGEGSLQKNRRLEWYGHQHGSIMWRESVELFGESARLNSLGSSARVPCAVVICVMCKAARLLAQGQFWSSEEGECLPLEVWKLLLLPSKSREDVTVDTRIGRGIMKCKM